MTESREFHVATVLSVLTGRLFAPGGIGDIYDILGYLSGDTSIMTHQIPRVMDEVEPYLREQLPELAKVEIPTEGMDTFEAIFTWMDLNVYDTFGEMIAVSPIPAEGHTYIDPISELIMKKPDIQIVVVEEHDGGES